MPYSKKTLAVKNFGELQHFAKFFANFHDFHSIPYVNGLQFTKAFYAKLPTVLIHQTFYHQIFLLYGIFIPQNIDHYCRI